MCRLTPVATVLEERRTVCGASGEPPASLGLIENRNMFKVFLCFGLGVGK